MLLLTALGCSLPTSGHPQDRVLHRSVPDHQMTVLDTLPPVPEGSLQECRTAPPRLAIGKAVAAAGWQVISENRLDGYGLVTFAANSSPGPEGVCEFENGALAIFDGERPLGLYWSSSEVFGDLKADREGVIDVYTSSFPVVPVAQLRHQQGGFVLQDLPATLPACNGQVEVPQLWRAPVGKMRASLIELGWVPQNPAAEDPISAEMQMKGFPETESCSGTGVNYCSYNYVRPEAKLRLITVGELRGEDQPIVADHELTCLETAK